MRGVLNAAAGRLQIDEVFTLAAILFAAMYVAWNYYPHPQIQLPIPIVTTYTYPTGGG